MSTSEQYIKTFKNELERRNRTSKNYVECITAFFRFAYDTNPIGIDKKEVYVNYAKSWVNRLHNWRGCSAKTVNLHIAAIKKFSSLVLGFELTLEDIPRLREQKKLPDPLSAGEVHRIFEAVKNKKHLLLLKIAYYGGLRLGDIRNLKVKNLRYESGLIHIENGKGKKDRYVPFPDSLHDDAKMQGAGKLGNDYLFTAGFTGKQYHEKTIQMIFKNACTAAGIEGKTNIHRLRHSCGYHMVQRGVNLRIIQDIFGHNSSRTTELYTKVAPSDISSVRNSLVKVMGN